jgi:hypothetical protein
MVGFLVGFLMPTLCFGDLSFWCHRLIQITNKNGKFELMCTVLRLFFNLLMQLLLSCLICPLLNILAILK